MQVNAYAYADIITKELLEEEYTEKERLIKDIAKDIGCQPTTIAFYMKKFGIEKRPRCKDLIGQKFGGWTVIKKIGLINGGYVWLCECKCGRRKQISHSHLNERPGSQCMKCSAKERPLKQEIYKTFFTMVVNRAKNEGLEFDLTHEYVLELFLKQNRKCALSGLDIYFARKTRDHCGLNGSTASLDRINSSLGYVVGNVQWLHRDVNQIKGNWNEEYFVYLCNNIAKTSYVETPEVPERKRDRRPTKRNGFKAPPSSQ